MMIRIDRLHSTFINVPKTGSTSMRDFLFENVFGQNDICTLHRRESYGVSIKHTSSSHQTVGYCIDHSLSPITDTFYLVVREPLERQLSRFFYRINSGAMRDIRPSNFQRLVIEGNGLLPDPRHRYQEALQYTFADVRTKCVWWRVEDLNDRMEDLARQNSILIKHPIRRENSSFSGTINTKDCLNAYYDKETRRLAEEYHARDIELYERVTYEARQGSH